MRFSSPIHRALGPAGALVSQFIVSATTFLTSVIVGRFGSPDELGVFTLGWSFIPFCLSIQWALVTMPYTFLNVRPNKRCSGNHAQYAAVQNFILMILISLFLASIGLLIRTPDNVSEFRRVFLVLAVSMPFILFREFWRRVLMEELKFIVVSVLDSVVAVVQIGALLWFSSIGQISGTIAILILGVSSGIGTAIFFPTFFNAIFSEKPKFGTFLAANLNFGKWVLAARTCSHLRIMFIPWALAVFLNSSATGEYAAIYNIAFLASPVVLALGSYLAPSISRAFVLGGKQRVQRQVRYVTTLSVLFSVIFLLSLAIFWDDILLLTYGVEFTSNFPTVLAMGLALCMQCFEVGPANGLLAIRALSVNFWVNLLSLATTIIAAVVCVPIYGVTGAAFSFASGSIVGAVLKLYFFETSPGVPSIVEIQESEG